jgi:hypothetical protein
MREGPHPIRVANRYKICGDKFYSYWVPGLIELIFPDWYLRCMHRPTAVNRFLNWQSAPKNRKRSRKGLSGCASFFAGLLYAIRIPIQSHRCRTP